MNADDWTTLLENGTEITTSNWQETASSFESLELKHAILVGIKDYGIENPYPLHQVNSDGIDF